MGKKDQRTKGNTKAASSARSAQQLGDNVGFVGFGTAVESAFVPLLQASDVEDGVPGEFRLALRKMHKKDVTTKVKALQEFLELLEKEENGAEVVAALLPYWPQVYGKLATDTDRRVRELAHTALAAVVRPVGKALALHLKAMVGPWFLGMADPHSQAAAAATAAWQAAFPAAKQAGAVTFCQAEILAAVTDNLTVATAQSLSDPKTTPVEEMEAKYSRTLAMSLASLTRLLATVTSPLEQDLLAPLLDQAKFWKLAKHKVGSVRQAFFECVVQLGASQASSLTARARQVVTAVLPGLLETEARAARAVWAAALQVLTVIPEAWELTSPHKAVFPAVFKFISSSPSLASSTFPSLLPFLSKVTVQVMGEPDKFLGRWFAAYLECLAIARGSSELAAVVGSYVECLMYVLGQQTVEPGLRLVLLQGHLVPLLVRSMAEPRLADCGLHQVMGPCLGAWDRAAGGEVKELNKAFWGAVGREMKERVEGEEESRAEQGIELLGRMRREGGQLESMEELVVELWQLLAGQVQGGLRVSSSCSRLSLLLRLLATPHLRIRLMPQGEQEFLQAALLPLLATQHSAPACRLLWAVVRELPAPALSQLLGSVSRQQPGASLHLLEAVGREAASSEAVQGWLQGEDMREYGLGLLEGAARGEGGLDTLNTLKSAGFKLNTTELFGRVVTCISSVLPGPSATSCQVELACGLMAAVEVGHLWREEVARPLLLELYSWDSGQAGQQLRDKLEAAWSRGVGGGLEDSIAELVLQQLVEEGEEQGRLVAKCVAVLERLGGLEGGQELADTFLLATVPSQEQLGVLGQEAQYQAVVQQEQYLASCPLTQDFPSSCPPSLRRPQAALVLSHLLLHRLGLPPSAAEEEEEEDCSTVADSVRRGLGERYTGHLAELLLCMTYTSRLAARPGCGEALASLHRALGASCRALVSHLDSSTCSRLQHCVRGRSLSEGGLWAACLAWLVRLQYRRSDWEVRLSALLPRVQDWSQGELATAGAVLGLATELDTAGGMAGQTLGVESARIVSLGGLASPQAPPLAWLVGRCLALSSPAQVRAVEGEVRAVLDTLLAWRAGGGDRLLYSRDLSSAAWCDLSTVSTVAALLATAVTRCPAALSPELWDLASCSLVSWAASLEETGPALQASPGPAMFAVAVAKLGAALGARLGPRGHHPALSPPPLEQAEEELPPKLREEWTEFFSEGVFSALLRVFVTLVDSPDPALLRSCLQSELGGALVHCPAPLLLSTPLPALHMPQDVDLPHPLPPSLTYLYNHLAPMLLSPSRHTQVSASHLLAATATDLVTAQTEGEGEDEEEEKSPPSRLMEVVSRGGAALESVLADYRVGELAPPIPPSCAAHTASLGFLLAWRVVLALVQAAGLELRPRYTEFLRAQGHLAQLLDHLFRILPTAPSAMDGLDIAPALLPGHAPTSELVSLAMSCWVAVCRHLPALARGWWQAQDRTASSGVEKITSAVVTPLLWREETRAIHEAEASDNMALRLRDTVREVVATYTIDEGSMELVVSLPANHPLGGLSVESGKRVGVDTGQWRKWMLQLTTFLTHQNGTILDGLNLWRKNVDKRFEGVEECYICFYILHGSNHQLPKLGCRTCKKKFHSACLYKWFSTSNNSSCPLCRNLF